MNQYVEGLVGIVVGAIIIAFRKRLAQHIIKFQNGTFRFNYGQREIDGTQVVCAAAGVFMIVLGSLLLLGIIDRH